MENLVTQIDQTFLNAPVSLRGIRDWLGVKISTDNTIDEPMLDKNDIQGIPLAITVHKAKGLEFDLVLIPFAEKSFRTNKYMPNVQTVTQGRNGGQQVLWKWKVGSQTYTNVSNEDSELWDADNREIIKEEARLLYVALTRAAESLVLFEKRVSTTPKFSWLFFIDGGRN